MNQMPSPWRCLEELQHLCAVPLVWRTMLGPDFPAFQTLCLQTTTWLAESIPCPLRCGCWHHIVGSTLPGARWWLSPLQVAWVEAGARGWWEGKPMARVLRARFEDRCSSSCLF